MTAVEGREREREREDGTQPKSDGDALKANAKDRMGGGDSSDEDEYVFYGTPIVDEADVRAQQQRRGGGSQQQTADPSAVRALPVHCRRCARIS